MRVVYKIPEIVTSIVKAIEQARIADREIDCIELLTYEWDEFRDYMLRFTPTRLVTNEVLFQGVTIKRGIG
jgi:hypothetical protein